ncbi:hypothetical protein EDF56_102345 [Novosphingobium sp. PhB165]|uniref:hypothetical protein n=1 Tax=Novosphingobium sp. PhB165 TaxID=2485105 RepID=UPI00104DC724|nr:hypothetical protein [Novosphingobium sp. PhB165]TCM20682.1 hypothetical protein EDF56_102345 [Novosphingobium sp. PhB165]
MTKRTGLLTILVMCLTSQSGHAATSQEHAFGRAEISTIPFDARLGLRVATYTPSGKVLVVYAQDHSNDRAITVATMDDSGQNLRPFYSGVIPAREKDNGLRFMVFPDNKRIFLGDFVLECSTSLETCKQPKLLPVVYPQEVAGGDHVSHRWSEIVVAPDNRHVAWTTLLLPSSALVFTGELKRTGEAYTIASPRIVSTMNPFHQDPAHPDGVVPEYIKGGEVKQFVAGGAALSLAGGLKRDTPDSVIQDIATGEVKAITDTPGYNETTIVSPDGRLGLTMTTRFSRPSDPAILGLLPRPYPTALGMDLAMFAYTYSVTGVRLGRAGNIGPALIDLEVSKSTPGYLGANLNEQGDWAFYSPMSWHPSSKRGLWIEGLKGAKDKRIRIVRLPDYKPGPAVRAVPTPEPGRYASSELSQVRAFAATNRDVDVKVYGQASGRILFRRTASHIEKIYENFSDDGRSVYSGKETMVINPAGRSTYNADLRVSGPKPGAMELQMTFGPLGGEHPAALIFAPDASGQPGTRGFAEYEGHRLDAADLVP